MLNGCPGIEDSLSPAYTGKVIHRTTRRSKIVCTLGPAVSNGPAIEDLLLAGMDVARVNFSHGTHENHAQLINWVREAGKKHGKVTAILGDLQGPKIRTGRLLSQTDQKPQSSLPISIGQKLFFFGGESGKMAPGTGSQTSPIGISYPRLAQDLKAGQSVLFDDGLIQMRVTRVLVPENLVELEVENGQILGENKGVNMPSSRLSTLGITEKDWDDINFALRAGVDFLALSFVRSAREVKSLKSFLDSQGIGIRIIAKIEKREAVDNIDEILNFADGIMVARGDLGVEVGNENVPVLQKQLIQKARSCGKPVITATQMLMSMVNQPSPSRAEASDVANAVFDGSDALMLSNETASGQFPIHAVRTMATIIQGAEGMSGREFTAPTALVASTIMKGADKLPISEAIEAAATALARALDASCLACLTRSGQAARLLAKYRAPLPIFAFAENTLVQAQLCLSWGVTVIPWREHKELDHAVFDQMLEELKRRQLISSKSYAVMTAGIPTSLKVGTTNTVVVKEAP